MSFPIECDNAFIRVLLRRRRSGAALGKFYLSSVNHFKGSERYFKWKLLCKNIPEGIDRSAPNVSKLSLSFFRRFFFEWINSKCQCEGLFAKLTNVTAILSAFSYRKLHNQREFCILGIREIKFLILYTVCKSGFGIGSKLVKICFLVSWR